MRPIVILHAFPSFLCWTILHYLLLLSLQTKAQQLKCIYSEAQCSCRQRTLVDGGCITEQEALNTDTCGKTICDRSWRCDCFQFTDICERSRCIQWTTIRNVTSSNNATCIPSGYVECAIKVTSSLDADDQSASELQPIISSSSPTPSSLRGVSPTTSLSNAPFPSLIPTAGEVLGTEDEELPPTPSMSSSALSIQPDDIIESPAASPIALSSSLSTPSPSQTPLPSPTLPASSLSILPSASASATVQSESLGTPSTSMTVSATPRVECVTSEHCPVGERCILGSCRAPGECDEILQSYCEALKSDVICCSTGSDCVMDHLERITPVCATRCDTTCTSEGDRIECVFEEEPLNALDGKVIGVCPAVVS